MGEFEETTEFTIENESTATEGWEQSELATTPHGEVVVKRGGRVVKHQKMENKIKVYVLENTGSQKGNWFDGSYAMVYIKEQHAWLQQINYTGESLESHTKAYKKPLPLRSLDTGVEEARIVWKKFVDEGYNRLSLARFDNPCHLNTLIDEDIEIIA